MASGPTLPPQAYTREILTAAFNWLQSQPESVKKLATTPDALVGLYMRAQRYGHSSLEADAPVSAQNFMSDLKNLAEGLKQFEGPGSQKAFAAQTESAATNRSLNQYLNGGAQSFHAQAAVYQPPAHQAPVYQSNTFTANTFPANTYQPPTHQAPAQNPSRPVYSPTSEEFQPQTGLNSRSQEMIHEVKERLNLSSDAEAINMMVALAYKNLKDLLA